MAVLVERHIIGVRAQQAQHVMELGLEGGIGDRCDQDLAPMGHTVHGLQQTHRLRMMICVHELSVI